LSDEGRAGAQLVERLYQISPSNDSMIALSKAGVTSAMQIASLKPDAFVARFGQAFPSTTEARLAHAQAQTVHGTALHVATMYLAYRSAPNLYALTGSRRRLEVAADESIPAAATLDELFGSMDYCACQECRSVLSTAAYLVDLLEMLDLSDLPHTRRNPIDVLLERRPDLAHLALSCENTNVALPYLDIVTEILEHYVVNGGLSAFTGHDMAETTRTNDLLADPEFVMDAAYAPLHAAVHPAGLPFDLPLTHLRLLFQVWDTTLADALAVVAGDHATARRERLGLNAPEQRLLTDTTFHEIGEYFGEAAGTTIDALNDAIAAGDVFCQRAGIRYKELADLLQARSVNPSITVVPLLAGLGVPIGQIAARWAGTLDDDGLRALVPAGVDLAAYGGDVPAWLDANRSAIGSLVTLTDMSAEPTCDFGQVQLRTALPDMASNRLDALAYRRLQRFIAVWRKLGWSITLTDRAVVAFLGLAPEQVTEANIDATWAAMLDRLANFRAVLGRRDVSGRQIADWLSLFEAGDPAARRALLATLLRAGATDLDHLAEMSGLDPLADDLGADAPSVLGFLDLWDAVKASPLKVADLDFLLRHDDPTGKFDVAVADVRRDVRALREALSAVDADLAVAPATADVGAVRAKMAGVYDSTVTDWFFGIVGRTRTYTAPLDTVEESLSSKFTMIAPTIRIDPFRRQLAVDGLLDATTATALGAVADGLVAADVEVVIAPADRSAFVASLKTAIAALRAAGDADIAELAVEHPELATIAATVAAADPATQATTILGAVLPELRTGLKNVALHTGLAAITKADADVVDAICGPDVLHAESVPASGILADLLAVEQPPSFTADGRVELLVDPPATGDVVLYVVAPAGTQVTLAVDGAPTIPTTAVAAAGEVRGTATLTAGLLTNVDLTLAGLPAGARATLRWRSIGVAKSDVPATKIYDAAAVVRAGRALARIRKLVMLQKALGLSGAEVTHLGVRTAATTGVWDALDVDATITPAELQTQLVRVGWLLWFAALKGAREGEPGTLVELLITPGLRNARGRSVLAGVMEWDETDLTAVLVDLALSIDDLSSLANLRRVADVMTFVSATLQPAADLISWTAAAPVNTLLGTIRDTLRGRMDDAAWLESMQSVSDQLRNARRDALVAYILHHSPPTPQITTPDELYEHFLVDVQMDACMQTSRIRLALSTIQLFVTRCLMNLEDDVSPDSIDADHWQWMKRYRVWEANRKVFLYPENWLEPELRDGKSPFFRDLESELLKADITDDAAELAYLTYLKKLDDVARLHISATYLEQGRAGNPDDDVLHVFARTMGATREHWYRRHEYGSWTPWEKVSLNIEGEILVPIVWKTQLFLFWTSVVTKSDGGNSNKSPQDISDESWGQYAQVTAEVTLHWGELYKGQWRSPKSTEATTTLVFDDMYSYDPRRLSVSARTFTPAGVSERLVLSVSHRSTNDRYTVVFTSKNAPPNVSGSTDDAPLTGVEQFNRILFNEGRTVRFDSNGVIGVSSGVALEIVQPDGAAVLVVGEEVLRKVDTGLPWFRGKAVVSPAENQWEVPVFYSDSIGVFVLIGDEEVRPDPLRWYTDAFIPKWNEQVLKIPPLYETPSVKVRPKIGDVFHQGIDPAVVDPNPVFDGIGLRDRTGAIDAVRIIDGGGFSFRGTTIDGPLTRRIIGLGEG
ncbi:MAG: neuraminidase-like domain-containing protein, partial [Ilumatobacteraceae bacterium]